jgi:hypothetical protein
MKKAIVKVTMPLFGCAGLVKYLEFLANGCDGGKYISNDYHDHVGLRKHPIKKVVATLEFTNHAAAKQFVENCKQTLNPVTVIYDIEVVARFDTLDEELEFRLKNHDEDYAMSDDHRVWLAGEDNLKRIKELRKLITEFTDKA